MEGGRKPFLIRVDPQLLKELEGWAQEELRSLNGQIEYLLKQAAQRRKRDAIPPADPLKQ